MRKIKEKEKKEWLEKKKKRQEEKQQRWQERQERLKVLEEQRKLETPEEQEGEEVKEGMVYKQKGQSDTIKSGGVMYRRKDKGEDKEEVQAEAEKEDE